MSATTDRRSIGQVLYETTKQPGWPGWDSALPGTRDHFERAAEVIFKRGHDARGKEERALTPKAKQYRDALRETVDALKAVTPVSGPDCTPACDRQRSGTQYDEQECCACGFEELRHYFGLAREQIIKAEAVLR